MSLTQFVHLSLKLGAILSHRVHLKIAVNDLHDWVFFQERQVCRGGTMLLTLLEGQSNLVLMDIRQLNAAKLSQHVCFARLAVALVSSLQGVRRHRRKE